jgi:predicted acylesterase/phospholipase RssA
MKALVISGGSKGAFAGGVAHLLEKEADKYDIFIGTSTGSLLISHLALNKNSKKKRYLPQ